MPFELRKSGKKIKKVYVKKGKYELSYEFGKGKEKKGKSGWGGLMKQYAETHMEGDYGVGISPMLHEGPRKKGKKSEFGSPFLD